MKKRQFTLTALCLSIAAFAMPASAQKKYDPGASDTEIKIGQTMLQWSGFCLWRDRQSPGRLLQAAE